jgi:hypothetical protein
MSPDDAERELEMLLREAAGEENREKLEVLLARVRVLLAELEKQRKK